MLQQGFVIIKDAKDDNNDVDNTFPLILCRIGLVCGLIRNTDKAMTVFKSLKTAIIVKIRDRETRARLFHKFGLKVNRIHTQVAAAAANA